ncbi:MAG: VOC family protein [Actinobacteria bacterium]|nr:VOC family protein [Actinomycetota bacterium]
MTTAADGAHRPRLPDSLRLGPVHLTVSTLDGSIAFYERALGLRVHDRDGRVATMGTGGEDLVVVVEEPGAAPGGRHAGLYHYALRFEERRELARAVKRLATTQTRIEGASDHGVSEAIYLRDVDDNGIELYADRPRERWPPPRVGGERVEMYTIALDMPELMRCIEAEEPRAHAGAGVVVGHVHLHVGDVEQALAFYRDVLGFEVMVNLGNAVFVSAGGYHHHLGFNVWLGRDVQPRPSRAAGLREWTVLLASREELAAVRARVAAAGLEVHAHRGGFLVRDPWETAVAFRVG